MLSSRQASAEVYVSAWDGSNPRKVFEWTSTPTITWSPDSQSLLIAAYPGGSSSIETDRVVFFLYSLADGDAEGDQFAAGCRQ